MAKELQKKLERKLQGIKIECIATEYAGHARKLAYDMAKAESRPLIISSSGDGGYNEVVNGIMQAANPKAICAVLPAGNANDHSRTMQDESLDRAIVKGKVRRLDLLKVTVGKGDSRYAHSYVGLGITPVVATELNRHTLNAFKETFIIFKTFFTYRPFTIRYNGKLLKLDSLLFGNINQMAKVLTIASENKPNDGKFEVILFPSGHKWKLIKQLAKAAAHHLESVKSVESYEFTTIKKMPMQMDGEVMSLAADSTVCIESAPGALSTIQ